MAIFITYFVHGTTTDNELGLATGHRPGKLSPLGINQSKELSITLSKKHFDVAFSSDLKRAFDSAKLVFNDKIKIIKDSRLREADYGDFTLSPVSNFKSNLLQYVDKPFPNGECYLDVEARVKDFLKFIKKEYPKKKVAIMSHQAPQLALEVLINKKTWKQAFQSDWRIIGSWQPGWDYILR